MQVDLACRRYLGRHSEAGLEDAHCPPGSWRNVLVIPAYRESPALLQRLAGLSPGSGRSLVLLVLNRPDSDPDRNANSALRQACRALPMSAALPAAMGARTLNDHTDLYLHDLEALRGPIAAAQGVGLARKTGCDLAFRWMVQGVITGPWIHSGDADATFPADYFQQLEKLPTTTVAATYAFCHTAGADASCNTATALYELRLHHYRLGLEYAASPYALHTLGSCLAIRAERYAQVRGFPKRAGGEDFYLLNKLAKLGPVATLSGNCIELKSRHSHRAPFGTGPAVAAISAGDSPLDTPLFYHPACFAALRCLLQAIPALQQNHHRDALRQQLQTGRLDAELIEAVIAVMQALGLERALQHCRRQGKTAGQFLRQFHQWFDAFRTLKFIHGIRDRGWPRQSLSQLQPLAPALWPASNTDADPETLRAAVMRHWGWPDPGATGRSLPTTARDPAGW